jgi:hypothetical protein
MLSQWLLFVVKLANVAMLRHCQGEFLLDNPFALIEGHPAVCSLKSRVVENPEG